MIKGHQDEVCAERAEQLRVKYEQIEQQQQGRFLLPFLLYHW